jgi:hypothetical protein
MMGFFIGALAGGLAATYWHAELGQLRERHVPQFRNQAAEKVKGAEQALVRMIESASTRARASLRPDQAPKAGDGSGLKASSE